MKIFQNICPRLAAHSLGALTCGAAFTVAVGMALAVYGGLGQMPGKAAQEIGFAFPETEEKLETFANDFLTAEGLDAITPAAGDS